MANTNEDIGCEPLESDAKGFSLPDFEALLRGTSDALDANLQCIHKHIPIPNSKTVLHGHFVIVDANGNDRTDRLAKTLSHRIVDYAIPRSQYDEARKKDEANNTSENVGQLFDEARSLFTDLDRTGEGGELLLFLLTENFLKIPQLLCKMSLKTDSRDHFKGSDGVYGFVDKDGFLRLFWGESKIYNDIQSSIRECLNSLAPFLLDPEKNEMARTSDIFLLKGNLNLNDENLIQALKNYLDTKHKNSNKVIYCGIGLAGFDHNAYKASPPDNFMDKITTIISAELDDWKTRVSKKINDEKLDRFEIHFFCVALPSADSFRQAFLKAIGRTT